MAVVYITEYSRSGVGPNGKEIPVPMEPPIAEQTVAITAGSVQSAAFNIATVLVRIHTDAICSKLIGSNPTAVATSGRMAAGTTEYVALDKQRDAATTAGALKIAVITNT